MLDQDVKIVYQRPAGFEDRSTHYCPGCTHGVAHRLIAEVLEEMGELGNTIGVAPVGCAVFAYNYFNFDFAESPHGRAPAMATGIKRTLPDKMVFTYQGDGDLASIGMAEIVAAAARGEQIRTIFINKKKYQLDEGKNKLVLQRPISVLSSTLKWDNFDLDSYIGKVGSFIKVVKHTFEIDFSEMIYQNIYWEFIDYSYINKDYLFKDIDLNKQQNYLFIYKSKIEKVTKVLKVNHAS